MLGLRPVPLPDRVRAFWDIFIITLLALFGIASLVSAAVLGLMLGAAL